MGKVITGIKGRVTKIFSLVKDFITKNPKLSVLIILILTASYIFINIEILHFTSSPKFCRNCHPAETVGPLGEYYTWSKNIHAYAGVECLDCHGKPGFIGYMRAKMGGLYDVYAEFLKSKDYKLAVLQKASDPTYAARLVPNEVCLFCHSDQFNQSIRKDRWMTIGVKMRKMDGVYNPEFRKKLNMIDVLTEETRGDVEPRHRQHLEKGLNCVDCHLRVAHGGEKRNLTKMQTCFDCHDKTRTPKMPKNEDCTACHRQTERVLPKDPITFKKGSSPVNFNHASHVIGQQCSICHMGIFPMTKGTTTVEFRDHEGGNLCFACHNGQKAFTWKDCSTCHRGRPPAPPVPIIYKVQGLSPVEFSHNFHAKAFACDSCHLQIWPMQRGIKKMKMEDLYQGKYCGSCHNGNLAFSSMDCAKCHIDKKGAKRQ